MPWNRPLYILFAIVKEIRESRVIRRCLRFLKYPYFSMIYSEFKALARPLLSPLTKSQTRARGGRKMTTRTKTMTTQAAAHQGWETVKAWAKATFTRQRIQEAALCAATVSVIGTVLFSLHRAMESYIILGF
jgi:hypothetical protein